MRLQLPTLAVIALLVTSLTSPITMAHATDSHVEDQSVKPINVQLDVPEEWTWDVLPYHVSFRALSNSVEQGNLTIWHMVDHTNISIFTPQVVLFEVTTNQSYYHRLFDIALNDSSRTMNITLMTSSLVERNIYNRTDGSTVVEHYVNVTSVSKEVSWSIPVSTESLEEITWLYHDYNYWGPNPAWKVRINGTHLEYREVDDLTNRNDLSVVSQESGLYHIDRSDWETIKEFVSISKAFRWQAFGYQGNMVMCDGPAHRNVLTMEFETFTNEVVEDYDFTDCDNYNTWVPDSFFDLRDLLVTVTEDSLDHPVETSTSPSSSSRNSIFSFLGLLMLPMLVLTNRFTTLRKRHLK